MYKVLNSVLSVLVVGSVWFMVAQWANVYRTYAPQNASVSHVQALQATLILETPSISSGLEKRQ